MIKLNKTMLSLGQQNTRVSQMGMVFLFDGPVPTDADIQYALMGSKEIEYSDSYPGVLHPVKLQTWANGRGNNLVGYSRVDSTIHKERKDDYFFSYPLSRNTHEFEGLVDAATPTWFVFMRNDTTSWTAPATVYVIKNAIFGTVGDENSEADMKLPGGTINASKTLKTNNIVLEEF